MRTKVKICGMRDPDNILEVGELKPDFMGFIFYATSPRCVPEDFSVPTDLPASIKKVGVFVNERLARILDIVKKNALDFVQLHGSETAQQCKILKESGVSVIKAFSLDDHFDFALTNPYKHFVDYFLFDTKGKFYGGNASTFDWNMLQKYDQEIPFFLSGGISISTISDLSQLRDMNLYAIDVNSGVEVSPGLKDINKIKELLNKLK